MGLHHSIVGCTSKNFDTQFQEEQKASNEKRTEEEKLITIAKKFTSILKIYQPTSTF